MRRMRQSHVILCPSVSLLSSLFIALDSVRSIHSSAITKAISDLQYCRAAILFLTEVLFCFVFFLVVQRYLAKLHGSKNINN